VSFERLGRTKDNAIGATKSPSQRVAARNCTAQVRNVRGIPTVHINGQPSFLSMYYCAYNTDRTVKLFWKDFVERAGFDLVFVIATKPLGRGVASSWWVGPGQYDFSQVAADLRKFLSVNPGAKIILSCGVDAPEWWNQRHAQELIQFTGETNPSYLASPASILWRRESGEAFRALIRHLEHGEYRSSIIGYRAAAQDGGGEWQFLGGWEGKYGDYSPAMKSYFRQWLKDPLRE
jgi:hypothetical protein